MAKKSDAIRDKVSFLRRKSSNLGGFFSSRGTRREGYAKYDFSRQ